MFFSQVPVARAEAIRLKACFNCFLKSCYAKLKDKNITELCKAKRVSTKNGEAKVAKTKTEKTKPTEEKKVSTKVTEIDALTML